MDPEIKNFSEIENFIRSNPHQADVLAGKWHEFVRLYPEVLQFESSEEFYTWTAENPNLHVDPDVWVGKEITDAYFYLRGQEEAGMPYETAGHMPGISLDGLGLAFLATTYLTAPKIIEDDPDYQVIVERTKQEWLQNNPGKDLTDKEGLDYIYGSLEKEGTVSPPHQDAEKEFRANPKYAKRVNRYDKERDKIYLNPKKDPALRQLSQTIEEHTRARFIHLQKENPDINLDAIRRQVEQRTYQAFVVKHQAKTEHYAAINPQIKSALEQRRTLEQKQIQPVITQQQVVATLGRAAPQVSSAPIQTAGPSLPVAGPLSRGINFTNRAGGLLSNPAQQLLGQGARTIAGMATRAGITALLPAWLPIVVLVFILLSTFLIVGFTNAPGSPGSQTGGTPPGAIGNLSSCQFTRDGQGVSLKSQKIADMFSEISLISSVPTAVLASVARHENPGFFQTITDDHPAVAQNFNNTKNASGDLGFMQINITHPLNIESNTQAAKRAAQKLGKQFNGLGYCRPSADIIDDANLDFCNIRDNIAVGAEILNNKLGAGSWQNLNDLEKASCYYHNLKCKYPDKNTGPFNYGQEVRRDYENCQQTQLVSSPQAPGGTSLSLLSGIVQTASQIVQKLTKVGKFYAAKLDEGITGLEPNVYWCTYLIVDSYNKVAATGLDRLRHGAVVNMKSYFKNTQANGGKLRFLEPATPVSQLRPSDTIFFEGRGQHTTLVKSIILDPNGNGTITTYDSNNVVLEDEVSVRNYRALNARTTAHMYSITGFGQIVYE